VNASLINSHYLHPVVQHLQRVTPAICLSYARPALSPYATALRELKPLAKPGNADANTIWV